MGGLAWAVEVDRRRALLQADCMAGLTIELPSQADQTEFNLRRWDELLKDPKLARVEGRIETDRHGHIIMSPPPAPQHGRFQIEIGHLLRTP
jgi:hypothetical protein